MSNCKICTHPKCDAINEDRRSDANPDGLSIPQLAKKYRLPLGPTQYHFRFRHDLGGVGKSAVPGVQRAAKKFEPSLQWNKKGTEATAAVYQENAEEQIKALIRACGKDPAHYDWDPVFASLNSDGWKRDKEATYDPKKGTAYTGQTAVTKVKIWRVVDLDDNGNVLAIYQAKPVKITFASTNRLPIRQTTDLECAVALGDFQIGFFKDRFGVWRTFHDEAAIDVMFQIVADVEAAHGVDRLVNVGDYLDLPMFSIHTSALRAVLYGALNRAIQRGYEINVTLTGLTPNATRDMIQGNHDQRLRDMLAKVMPVLVGLQQAGTTKYDPPVLSLESLMRFEESGWRSSGRSYPNDSVMLNPNTRVIHGTVANADPGKTLSKLLTQEINTIQGHTPHGGTLYKTVTIGGHTRTYVASIVPGFMKTDGSVPAADSKGDDWGVPSKSDGKPWEQGFSVVFYDPKGKTVPLIEYISIFGGQATWRGKTYVARCDPDGSVMSENQRLTSSIGSNAPDTSGHDSFMGICSSQPAVPSVTVKRS